jgi:hypothetical protein
MTSTVSVVLTGLVLGLSPQPAWLEGLPVEMPELDYEFASVYGDTGRMDRAIAEMADALRGTDLEDLVGRCRAMVEDARPHVQAYRESSVRRDLQPLVKFPWVLCMATVRLIGQSRNSAWIPVLEEWYVQWSDVAPMDTDSHSWISTEMILQRETGDAYYSVAFEDIEPDDFVSIYREHLLSSREDRFSVRGHGIGRKMRAIREQKRWTPSLLALFSDESAVVRRRMLGQVQLRDAKVPVPHDVFIALLADPDPEVRSIATRLLTGGPFMAAELAPALVRFLGRDDIDDEARAAAEEALRIRGFTAAFGPEGPEPVPIEGHRPILPGDPRLRRSVRPSAPAP